MLLFVPPIRFSSSSCLFRYSKPRREWRTSPYLIDPNGTVFVLVQSRARVQPRGRSRESRIRTLCVASVQPGSIALVPSPYPGGQDTVVLVVGLDTTGRTADVVPLTAAGRSGNAATLYEREAGATTSFERVDKLVPIQGAERDDSKDAWVVLQANIEAAKARYLSPSGQAAARAEMEQLEANIDPRIFEREPQAPASLQQLWIGSGLAAGAALACLVMQSQATMKSAESATSVLNGIAAFLGIVAVGLALAALRNQSGES